MARPKRVLVLSDLHAGSALAPWPADCPLAEGGRHSPNKFQTYLNDCWADMLDTARSLKPAAIVLNGDLVQGCHADRDGQLVTTNPAIQARAALMLLEPLAACTKRLYVVRGTEWHEGKTSDHVEQLAHTLGAIANPATGTHTWPSLNLAFGKSIVSFAHHIGTSSIPFYTATVPQRELLAQILEYAMAYGADAPRLRCIVRSHRHRYVAVKPRPGLLAVVTPAWQYKTAYAEAKVPALLSDTGYIVLELQGNDIEHRARLYPNPLPHAEVI